MNHFSYPLTIIQINIFVEPQNIFPNQNPRPQTIEPAPPRIFNYRVPPRAPSAYTVKGTSDHSGVLEYHIHFLK